MVVLIVNLIVNLSFVVLESSAERLNIHGNSI